LLQYSATSQVPADALQTVVFEISKQLEVQQSPSKVLPSSLNCDEKTLSIIVPLFSSSFNSISTNTNTIQICTNTYTTETLESINYFSYRNITCKLPRHLFVLVQLAPSGFLVSGGHVAAVPSQYSAESQLPLVSTDALQTVVGGAFISAGQFGELPLQVSTGSQTPLL
jgi:hypothetical protein